MTDVAKTRQARIITGNIFGRYEVTDQVADVRVLLAPLARDDVRTVRCLGLNYALHAKEAGLPLPKYPVLFVSISLPRPRDNKNDFFRDTMMY